MSALISLSKTLFFFIILTVFIAKDAAEFAKKKTQFTEAPAFYNSPYCDETPSEKDNYECNDQVVNIAMTLDKTYLRGSMAAIFSIFKHSNCPENLYFHLIAALNKQEEDDEEEEFETTISKSFPYIRFTIYRFDEERVRGLISTSVREALDRPLNYARSYLADLLPDCVRRAIYLDSDVILADDIAELFSTPIRPEFALAAPEYCNANFPGYFTSAFWSNPTLSFEFAERQACYFNTGVMVVNLDKWREEDYRQRIEEWMDLQKWMRIYELGSLPPFLLVFAGKIEPVDHRWNQHGLGGDNSEGRCRNLHPGPVSLMHWSGRGKPWVRLDGKRPCSVDALWDPYDLLDKGRFSLEF